MKYYTVTSDYNPVDGGNSHALLIMKATSKTMALNYFQSLYGFTASNKANVLEDIHIENGFNDLLTEQAKKILVKIKSKNPSAPADFTYTNRTHTKYLD